MKRINTIKGARKERIFLDRESFEIFVDEKLTSMAGKKTTEKGPAATMKYVYGKIDTKEYYQYVGKKFCAKDNNEGGYYYMDNINVTYNTANLNMDIEWIVVEWGKNGDHTRSKPAFL